LCLHYVGDIVIDTRSKKNDTVGHEPGKHIHLSEGHLPFFDDGPSHVVGLVVGMGNKVPHRLAV